MNGTQIAIFYSCFTNYYLHLQVLNERMSVEKGYTTNEDFRFLLGL